MLLFFDLGTGEIFIIILFVLIFFGSKRLPEFARGLGKGIRQFKDAAQGIQDDIRSSVREVNADIAKARESVTSPIEKAAKQASVSSEESSKKSGDSKPGKEADSVEDNSDPVKKVPIVEPVDQSVSRSSRRSVEDSEPSKSK